MARDRNKGGARGPSQRQLRVGETIRRALAEVLMRGEAHGLGMAAASITVTEVRPSPDLRQATVYVMPLGGRDPEGAIAALMEARGEIRRSVDRRLSLKYSPDLKFVIDDTFDRYDETRAMLNRDTVRRDLEG
ncbi:30S ribosome-binding factor RbfA [Paralimibaculum aggregatum]|nr:30S ribosome-binding factor RbfA [Limibaculum sp. NKW23]